MRQKLLVEQQKMELWDFGKKDGEFNWEVSGKTERAWAKVILQDWKKDLEYMEGPWVRGWWQVCPGWEKAWDRRCWARRTEVDTCCLRVALQWGLMPVGVEARVWLQPCSFHLPTPLGARTMADASSGCVCCINLAGWTQNAVWEQTLLSEGEALMRAVCGNTMQPSSEPCAGKELQFILLFPAPVHMAYQVQTCFILIVFFFCLIKLPGN